MRNSLAFALLVTGFFRAPLVQAQKQFQPGYLVLQSGDTLRGSLEAPTRSTLTMKVKFKKTPQGAESLVYPLKLVRGLQLTGGKAYVMRNMQPIMGHDTLRILLEPLVLGRANLYRSLRNVLTNNPEAEMYSNTFGSVYYYIERAAETKRPPYLLSPNTYWQDLKSLFSDCTTAPPITGQFSESNLVRLVRQYNACPASPTK